MSAAVSTVTGVIGTNRQLYRFEPEVRDWLDSLSDSGLTRVDREVPGLGGPWPDHLEGAVRERGLLFLQTECRWNAYRAHQLRRADPRAASPHRRRRRLLRADGTQPGTDPVADWVLDRQAADNREHGRRFL